MAAENSALYHSNKLHFKIYLKNIYILDNAALVNKTSFKNIKKIGNTLV